MGEKKGDRPKHKSQNGMGQGRGSKTSWRGDTSKKNEKGPAAGSEWWLEGGEGKKRVVGNRSEFMWGRS